MSKIPGVGYKPSPGTCYWVWPGGASAGTTPFNPGTPDPFTAANGQLDLASFNARYGGRPVRADGTVGMFVVDAETVMGALTRAMELAAKQGAARDFSGGSDTHTMVPTILEAHDYAATHPDGGRSLMTQMGVGGGAAGGGGSKPGQPRIDALTSPAEGQILVKWTTGAADAFEISVSPAVGKPAALLFPDRKQGNAREELVSLRAGEGGMVSVMLRALRGGAFGKWSKARTVGVKPSTATAEEPPVDPITPPAPVSGLISPPGTLSPASVRCEELRGILRQIPGLPAPASWLIGDGWVVGKVFAVPLLRGWRLWQRSLGDSRTIPPDDQLTP